jgi:2-polyprenyl-6-hydroxyphenyl methylase/3-demethylubiquinone-9 3-methyltransferase
MTEHTKRDKASFIYDRSPRYADGSEWQSDFVVRASSAFKRNMTILDVGAGRTPTIDVNQRPEGCRYLGLDVSASELEKAPNGAYAQTYAQDICTPRPELVDQVDLVVSWQVFEHVRPLEQAIDNIHTYLRHGGQLVAMLSGRNAIFAVLNRIVPERLGKEAMKHLLNREPDSVFRAHYDSCTYTELNILFQDWSNVEITPMFRGAAYLSFFRPAAISYLKYEDWALRRSKFDLATHYIISATK